MDLTGKKILQNIYKVPREYLQLNLDVDPGIYFLRFDTDTMPRSRKVIVE
jgi:hypothetical protein